MKARWEQKRLKPEPETHFIGREYLKPSTRKSLTALHASSTEMLTRKNRWFHTLYPCTPCTPCTHGTEAESGCRYPYMSWKRLHSDSGWVQQVSWIAGVVRQNCRRRHLEEKRNVCPTRHTRNYWWVIACSCMQPRMQIIHQNLGNPTSDVKPYTCLV